MFKIAYGRFIDFVFQKETMINIFLNKRFLFLFFLEVIQNHVSQD